MHHHMDYDDVEMMGPGKQGQRSGTLDSGGEDIHHDEPELSLGYHTLISERTSLGLSLDSFGDTVDLDGAQEAGTSRGTEGTARHNGGNPEDKDDEGWVPIEDADPDKAFDGDFYYPDDSSTTGLC